MIGPSYKLISYNKYLNFPIFKVPPVILAF